MTGPPLSASARRSTPSCRPVFACQRAVTNLGTQVTSKEANFVKVRLNHNLEAGISEPTDLLCSVRALLKKIKQTVLVGDNVEVDAVDWADKRGKASKNFLKLPHTTCIWCSVSFSESLQLLSTALTGLNLNLH